MPLMDRRAFLRAGAGVAALCGPWAAVAQEPPRVRGVIWLWMDGAVSPSLTWDPKPGGKAKAIPTAVPDIQISDLLPICASQMKNLSIVRSVTHGLGDLAFATWAMHTGWTSGFPKDVPTLGTILAHELARPDLSLPPNIVLDGPEIPESPVFGEGSLPFRLQSSRNPIPNLHRTVDATRDRDRAGLLLDQNKDWDSRRLQREIARVEQGIAASERLMNTPLLKAFQTAEEPAPLRSDYGNGFGESCLLARRLIQAGCGFVEIGLQGWESKPTEELVPLLDQGLGTLVRDLERKNLLKETVVVCASAFGRGMQVGTNPWTRGFSVVLAGGALPGGRVHGDTGEGGLDCKAPVEIRDLYATLYRACGVDGNQEYEKESRKVKYVSKGKPIEDLF
ncbi:MAG TPA: DUF1501 domain-containing protein [Planctomycetota bacterium]|nr:DUF1501 domain-containing protein [Planctomycetota bacterium]